jgi:uncharacterized protein (TIGR03000 family)
MYVLSSRPRTASVVAMAILLVAAAIENPGAALAQSRRQRPPSLAGYRYYYDPYSYGYTVPYGTPSPSDFPSSAQPVKEGYSALFPPPPVTPPPDTRAHLIINAPAEARLWLDNVLMSQTGALRYFDSPPLSGTGQYQYIIRAAWQDHDQQVTQTQSVLVTPGSYTAVKFPVDKEDSTPASQGQDAK